MYLDTINVIRVKPYMMVVLIWLSRLYHDREGFFPTVTVVSNMNAKTNCPIHQEVFVGSSSNFVCLVNTYTFK